MKAMNLHGLLLAGALALLTVSCKEERRDRYDDNRDDRNVLRDKDDRYDRDDNDYRNVSYTSSLSRETEMIVGETGNKVWKVRQDLNDTGIDEAYDDKEEFHFYKNNTFTISNKNSTRTGMWAYDGTKLTLKYTGDATLHPYTVGELTNNRIELVATNGAELVLVDKDFR